MHSPLTPETKHLFNDRAFAATKRGAFFINASRGGVMDEAAVLAALQSGQLAGAALDVRETEPPSAGSAFVLQRRSLPVPAPPVCVQAKRRGPGRFL